MCLCGWVSGRQRAGRTNMAKEEVVENKYAGYNIFLSFSFSSHFFFPAFSRGCFGPTPFRCAYLPLAHSRSHVLNSSSCTVLWFPCAAYCSTLKVKAARCMSGNLYQNAVLHPRTQHPSWRYFLLHLNSMWRVLNQTLLLNRMFIGPCIIVIVEELKTNLMSLVVFISLIFAQHVSNINMSIFGSLRLWWWITTSVILFCKDRCFCN